MTRALVIFIGLLPLTVAAQIELVPEAAPQAVFAGRPQVIRIALHNPGGKPAEADVRTRLFQLTSSAAVPVGDAQPWKKIQILPQQTVLETITFAFPEIRAATRFRVELVGIGRAEVMVYPGDLLKKLRALAGEKPLALLDPDNQLRPVVKQAGVEFTDLETEPSDARLAIVWSNTTTLPEAVIKRVKNGMAAVWIRKPTSVAAYAVRLGTGTVVVASPSSVSPLADSPTAQLNLVRFAELALEPEALRLPEDRKESE